MKLNMRLFILVLLLGLLAYGCGGPSQQDQENLKRLVVENLRVDDIPNDGGDGLMLSWKPLDKDKRVQEYRIYRGVHPDTLFFLAGVQVNVKTGVASDEMFYYDSGYSSLISLDSPTKLKNERGAKGSNLYRGVPRDAEIAARLSESFNLVAQIEDGDYYYKTSKARSADPDDDNIYAGLKFNQQTILASLKNAQPGEQPVEYYYSVVPVNERNQYLGIAKPVSGTPVDDAPQASPGLFAVAIEDTRTLQFEWQYPLNHDDLAMYAIYLIPGVQDSVWANMSVAEQDTLAAKTGVLLTQGMVGGGALKNNCTLTEMDLETAAEGLSWENAREASYCIRFVDGSMNQSPLSELSRPLLTDSGALPQIAKFKVEDKPMDKGDCITVTWQDPVVSVTKTSSLRKDGTKLKVNYQINKTDHQNIENVYFEFFEPGKTSPFAKVNEFYQDNIIHLNIPPQYSLKNGGDFPSDSLMVKITIAARPYKINPRNGRITYGKKALLEDYEMVQYLKPDPAMMAYMPTRELLLNGVDVSQVQNIVYRKSYRGSSYTLVKSSTSYENNLDVTVGYVSTVIKPISGFNFVKGNTLHSYMGGKRYSRKLEAGEKARDLSLVSSEIDLTLDQDSGTTLNTSIYLDEAKKIIPGLNSDLEEAQKELSAYRDSLALAATDEAKEGFQATITGLEQSISSLEGKIKAYSENKIFQKAINKDSNRGLMSFVASIREPESRKHTYSIVRTNGEALFTETAPDTDASGELKYYAPVSNWFDWNKLLTLIAVIIFGSLVVVFVNLAKKGKDLYMRPIAGLQEIDNAIGRATEMGRPMLYCMGNGSLSDVATMASLGILSLVAKKAAEYDTRLIVPCYDYIVMPIAQEIVREAHYAVGRPDSFDKNNVFYLTSVQFAYVAGVNGIMIREKMATNFFMGYFAAEALLMTETGNAVGAVQIAGSDAITQIPFFITTCDYTLIGEELYAASAYLNREPMLLGTLKAQDYFKFLILVLIITGTILASLQLTGLMQLFPLK
ncbi:MAG: hypothetical protein LHW57_00740 [Candidatus Cloacimonetes bacterium]|nr:hypothetical protein [Candidatus Cloacimonadota bacterium]